MKARPYFAAPFVGGLRLLAAVAAGQAALESKVPPAATKKAKRKVAKKTKTKKGKGC